MEVFSLVRNGRKGWDTWQIPQQRGRTLQEGSTGPALLGLFMNEPGKEADTQVTAFTSIPCLGGPVFKSSQKNLAKLLSNETTR